jgi:hypothetical protein
VITWGHQKPECRAVEGDEAAIEKWKQSVSPRAKKSLQGWQPIAADRV